MAQFLEQYGGYLLAGVFALALLWALAAGRRKTERQWTHLNRSLEQSSRRMAEMSQAMEGRQERLRDTLDQRMDSLQQNTNLQMEQLRREMSGGLDRRLGDSFRTVNEQLARVDKGLGEMQGLARSVGDMTKIMTNARARGAWGEVQLRGLMEEILSPGEYLENTPVVPGSTERVEFAVVMPGDEKTLLAIDSKFPVESYLRMDNAGGGDFEKRVLEEAKRISSKYVKPPYTTDYAVMFLPAESLYAEVARRRGLVERVQNECRVLISGPCTFAALLTSVKLGMRSVRIEKRGAEVLALLQGVQEEFSKYAETVAKAGQRARQLEDELNSVEVRARAVARRLRDISTDDV